MVMSDNNNITLKNRAVLREGGYTDPPLRGFECLLRCGDKTAEIIFKKPQQNLEWKEETQENDL